MMRGHTYIEYFYILSLPEGSNSWQWYMAASKCSRDRLISAKYKE